MQGTPGTLTVSYVESCSFQEAVGSQQYPGHEKIHLGQVGMFQVEMLLMFPEPCLFSSRS